MAVKKIGKVGEDGRGVSKGHSSGDTDSLQNLLLAVRAEMDDVRTKNALLLAKLDADTGLDESDYVSTLTLADATFEA